jgi:hypothetical protein
MGDAFQPSHFGTFKFDSSFSVLHLLPHIRTYNIELWQFVTYSGILKKFWFYFQCLPKLVANMCVLKLWAWVISEALNCLFWRFKVWLPYTLTPLNSHSLKSLLCIHEIISDYSVNRCLVMNWCTVVFHKSLDVK